MPGQSDFAEGLTDRTDLRLSTVTYEVVTYKSNIGVKRRNKIIPHIPYIFISKEQKNQHLKIQITITAFLI